MDQILLILEVLGITFIVPILLIIGTLTTFKKRTPIPQIISLVGAIMLLSVAIISVRPESTDIASADDQELVSFLQRGETKRVLQSWGLVVFSIGFAITGIQSRKKVEPVN